MKQNYYSVGSFTIFSVSSVAYILAFFMSLPFPNTLSIILLRLFPIIGIIFGCLGKKGFFKICGLIGNVLLLYINGCNPFRYLIFLESTLISFNDLINIDRGYLFATKTITSINHTY